MGYVLDPREALIDIDSTSLIEFTLHPDILDIKKQTLVEISIKLEGGLGRVFIDEIGDRFIEDSVTIKAKSILLLTNNDFENLRNLLESWIRIAPPLRYVDFGDKAVILEDSDRFIIIPKGIRDLKFDLPLI